MRAGLGSLGVGAMNAEAARKAIRDTRALTDKPFNVNVFCHAPATANVALEKAWLDWLAPLFAQFDPTPPQALTEIYTSFVVDEAMLKVFVEEKPAIVSFHFGLPSKHYIDALRAADIKLIASTISVKEAEQVVAAGMDAIVAQGIEAGRHRGVFDSSIDEGYRRTLLSDAVNRTTFTSAISGHVARSLVNKFTEVGHGKTAPAYPITYDAGKALHAAAKAKGDFGYGAQWAGQAAVLIRELPAAELMAQLKAELNETIAGLQKLLYA
ncbi:Enoyl-[acyl-carrier-protein] reductase [FMN] [Candidatus Burkholderia humilis]|nr:Enoyl-[acyl-carrier-protein] reductase [FMN] [Candidatus Burkholderia humilis]